MHAARLRVRVRVRVRVGLQFNVDFGGLVVVQCGRVPAVGRTAELAADSSGTAAKKRDVEGSKGVYVARAAVRAAWDAARSVFLVRVRVRF